MRVLHPGLQAQGLDVGFLGFFQVAPGLQQNPVIVENIGPTPILGQRRFVGFLGFLQSVQVIERKAEIIENVRVQGVAFKPPAVTFQRPGKVPGAIKGLTKVV